MGARLKGWKLVSLKRFSIFGKISNIENLFYNIANYLAFLPLILFLLFYNNIKKEKSIWTIVIYLVLIILTFFFEKYVPKTSVALKIFYGLTTFCEYSLFTYFIWANIQSKTARKVILITSCCFTLFLLLFYTNAKFYYLDSLAIGVESIFVLAYSSYFFYEQVNNPSVLFIYNDYKFWIITGIMIYLSGSFFIYIFANQIPSQQIIQYWNFIYIFSAVMYILFSIGILILGLKPTQKHHAKPKPNHHYLDITWCFYCRPQILPESHLYSF